MRFLLPAETGLIWNWKQNSSCSNWRGELSLHRSPLQSGSARVSSHGFSIGSHTLTNTNCEGGARQYDALVLNHLISENLCRRCHECDWKVGPSCLNMCSWTSDGVFCVTWWIFAGKRVGGPLCAARWRELTIVQLQKLPTLKWKSPGFLFNYQPIFYHPLDLNVFSGSSWILNEIHCNSLDFWCKHLAKNGRKQRDFIAKRSEIVKIYTTTKH